LFLNFRREEAAQFSFLIGLPAIALAGLKELWVLSQAHIAPAAWSHLLFGLLVASFSAFAAIWGLMKFLEKFSTSIFQSSNEPGAKLMEGSTVCRLTGLKAEV
jgi:undecaprenyl-diphosphatase